MGFEKNIAKRALQASFGNEEVAVQYCMDGIPDYGDFGSDGGMRMGNEGGENLDDDGEDMDPTLVDNLSDDQMRHLASLGRGGLGALAGGGLPVGRGQGGLGGLGGLGALGGGTGVGRGAGTGTGAGTGASTGGLAPLIPDLDSLIAQVQNNPLSHLPPAMQQALQSVASNPQLGQLRTLLSQNPGQLEQVLMALVQNNPQLQPVLEAYPREFVSVLTGAPLSAGRGRGRGRPDGPASGDVFGDNSMQFRRAANGSLSVQLSPDDSEKVDSIKAITGKPDGIVIEAYVACGKNVENTINFLFDM